jgi:dihydroorotase
MRICLKGARVVDPSQRLDQRCDLLIEGGMIAAQAPVLQVEAARSIDLNGKTVVPGFVDIHVHLREPGFTAKETISDGSAAAVAGGITALACMPNTAPAIDRVTMVELIRAKAEAAGLARVYPVAALTRDRQGQSAADLAGLYRAGVRAFSDDGSPVADDALFSQILRELAGYSDAVAISHSEDQFLAGSGVIHEGRWSRAYQVAGLPAVAESAAVGRDILLAQQAGCRLHLAHISTAGAVEWVAWAKERGLPVTAEVTPHHLLLTDAAVKRCGTLAKVNPPLRTAVDRLAVRRALREGIIDIIATDHAPHQAVEKNRPLAEAPFGITGLETAVALLLTELVHKGVLSLSELVEAYSCRPARLLGLPGGTLKQGSPADLVVLDLEAAGTVQPQHFYSKAKHSPFAGWKLKGLPVMTMVGGKIKMESGRVFPGKSHPLSE